MGGERKANNLFSEKGKERAFKAVSVRSREVFPFFNNKKEEVNFVVLFLRFSGAVNMS